MTRAKADSRCSHLSKALILEKFAMSKKTSFVLALLLLQSVAVFAQSAETPEVHRQLRDEFRRAEESAAKMAADSNAGHADFDRMTRERQSLEADIIHYKGQVAYAQGQLEAAQKSGVAADTTRWNNELANARVKLENTEARLQEVNASIKGAIVALQQSMGGPAAQSNLIVPGDNLDVMVAEDPTISRVYEVRSGGYIVITQGAVGRVQVAGKDLTAAENAIRDALGINYIKDAHVTVERNEARGNGRVIYLTGAFTKPGPWTVPAGYSPTVVTTILRNPVRPQGDLTRVRVLRLVGGQGVVEEVNVLAIQEGVSLPSDLPLNSGDIVVVPAFANVVYVTGSVKKPGTMPILPDDELTAYTAVLRSGGFVRFANRAKIFVLRDRGNGEKQRIDVNIKAVNKAKQNDVILEPKDIIVVPERFFSF
jgi:protein involved in polysaccharide export with SLBB domain